MLVCVCNNYHLLSTIICISSTPVVKSPLIERRQIFYVATSAIPGDCMHGVLSASYYYTGVVRYRTGRPEYNVLILSFIIFMITVYYISC